jgi:ABC-type Fe3+/spermidine/putrescine transport system ATPase subunit
MTFALNCANLGKSLGGKAVLTDLNLSVRAGEIVSLLGASGSGKSTLLRTIAGLIDPDAGTLTIHGSDVWSATRQVPAEARQVGMVFQDYALWPHLSVEANVKFGLRQRGLKPHDVEARVAHALTLTQMSSLGSRYPAELSGGQQQRVAIARCLAAKPALILFDEPLSNLDEALREDLRIEITRLVRHEGLTAIYVTHDQGEALAVSDRVAVMCAGSIAQYDRPDRVYDAPANAFVARFLGGFSLVKGVARNGSFIPLNLDVALTPADTSVSGQLHLVVRPEDARPADVFPDNRLVGRVLSSAYQGRCWRLLVAVGEHRLKIDWPHAPEDATHFAFSLPPRSCTLVPDA